MKEEKLNPTKEIWQLVMEMMLALPDSQKTKLAKALNVPVTAFDSDKSKLNALKTPLERIVKKYKPYDATQIDMKKQRCYEKDLKDYLYAFMALYLLASKFAIYGLQRVRIT